MIKEFLYRLLRRSEKYTKTDMVHFFSANFWLSASRVISVGSGILLTVAFANLLTPEAFGLYKYVIAAAGLVASFSLAGLVIPAMNAMAKGKKNVIPALVRSNIFWSVPASIGALGISIWYFAHSNSDLGYGFLFISLTNSFANGMGVTKGVWQAAGEYKMGTLLGIPKIVIPFVAILLTILFTQNVVWILLVYFFSNLAMSIFGYWIILWWFKIKGTHEEAKEHIREGKQITVLGFFQLVSGQIDQLLLWHFVGPAGLAVYALAIGPVKEAQNQVANFLTVLFPKMARKTTEEVHNMLPTRLWQLFIASSCITVFYIGVAPFLFTYIFPKYIEAIVVSQVLALTIVFQSKNIIDTFFITHGQIWNRSRIILISQAVEFALFLSLIPLFGLWGAVWATVLSEISAAIIFIGIYIRSRRADLNRFK